MVIRGMWPLPYVDNPVSLMPSDKAFCLKNWKSENLNANTPMKDDAMLQEDFANLEVKHLSSLSMRSANILCDLSE